MMKIIVPHYSLHCDENKWNKKVLVERENKNLTNNNQKKKKKKKTIGNQFHKEGNKTQFS